MESLKFRVHTYIDACGCCPTPLTSNRIGIGMGWAFPGRPPSCSCLEIRGKAFYITSLYPGVKYVPDRTLKSLWFLQRHGEWRLAGLLTREWRMYTPCVAKPESDGRVII